MKKYARILMIGLLGFAFFACSDSEEKALADSEIGIRKIDLQNEQDVALLQYEYFDAAAGESTLIERAFENAPPMIPHDTEGMLPITQEDNQCLLCHDPAIAADVGAVAAPASHIYDLRTNTRLESVSAARFNCVLCHTPQADIAPTIANTFTPAFRTDEAKSSSNLLDVLNEGVE